MKYYLIEGVDYTQRVITEESFSRLLYAGRLYAGRSGVLVLREATEREFIEFNIEDMEGKKKSMDTFSIIVELLTGFKTGFDYYMEFGTFAPFQAKGLQSASMIEGFKVGVLSDSKGILFDKPAPLAEYIEKIVAYLRKHI